MGYDVESTPLVNQGTAKNPLYSVTFHIEKIRIFAMMAFIVMMVTCMILTKVYVEPHMDMTQTVIYKLYGFNHSCNYLDHNPAREVAAILVVFLTYPLVLYNFLFHCRVYRAYEQGMVPKYVLNLSRFTTPFNIFSVAILHLWFVNTPDGDYGFLGHYIPYILSQIVLGFMAILQVFYLIATENLPWGIKPWLARIYICILIVFTITSQTCGLAIALGHPILDSANNERDRAILKTISNIYVPMAFVLPIVFAFEEIKNGDVTTITYA